MIFLSAKNPRHRQIPRTSSRQQESYSASATPRLILRELRENQNGENRSRVTWPFDTKEAALLFKVPFARVLRPTINARSRACSFSLFEGPTHRRPVHSYP